jgi:hypothetical protein
MRRTLLRAQQRDYRGQITSICIAHTLPVGDPSLCLYDVRTLYSEAENENVLRKVGFSKERRVGPRSRSGCRSTGAGSPWSPAADRVAICNVNRQLRPRDPRPSSATAPSKPIHQPFLTNNRLYST